MSMTRILHDRWQLHVSYR